MKLIDKKSFLPTVCVIYTMVSVGKIVIEAVTQEKFGNDQSNMLTILLFAFLGTLVLSQHYRLAQLPLLLVAVLQYVVLIAVVMLFTWISGFFTQLHPRAYMDMFRSFTVPYVIAAFMYYGSLYLEVQKANQLLGQIKEDYKNEDKK
ncbi:MAG: hypothetical protein K2O40_10405 [Lachnospiraceae bacterium]|nr:hypothetical protein [Lachnospiraceae bacterium]MDE7184861.1 hypothetical protein [Lachnospiraceae bacterium]